jgi:ornithine cyclodeaminase/alanine dehydrogenase-like protein (mu-crystallin family)
VFVEWAGAATCAPPAGATELQGVDPARVVEIGNVASGRHPGRTGPDVITVYKSTGHAIEDAAAARLVLDEARLHGVGIVLPR